MFGEHATSPKRRYLRVAVVAWIFFIFVLLELYTASLTSLITNQQSSLTASTVGVSGCPLQHFMVLNYVPVYYPKSPDECGFPMRCDAVVGGFL